MVDKTRKALYKRSPFAVTDFFVVNTASLMDGKLIKAFTFH